MDVLTETVVAIRNPYDFLWVNFINLFPKLVALIVLLIIGYLTGLVLGYVLKTALEKAGLDRLFDRTDLSKAIGKTHLSSIFGEILKWYVFIVFIQAAIDIIDVGILSQALGRFVLWMPHLILAIVIILIGIIFAHYVELKVLEHSKVKGVMSVIKFLKWVIVVMVLIIAFKQIGLKVDLLENAFLLIIGALAVGIALALGIALGLGFKRDGEKLIREFFKNF